MVFAGNALTMVHNTGAQTVKEIKAYVRPELLEAILPPLEEAGARDITVMRGVDALANLADQERDRWHFFRRYDEEYSGVAKLEIVCTDALSDKFVDLIRTHGHTGESGDGRVFVSTIDKAVSIRTGAAGEEAL